MYHESIVLFLIALCTCAQCGTIEINITISEKTDGEKQTLVFVRPIINGQTSQNDGDANTALQPSNVTTVITQINTSANTTDASNSTDSAAGPLTPVDGAAKPANEAAGSADSGAQPANEAIAPADGGTTAATPETPTPAATTPSTAAETTIAATPAPAPA
ncbi:clathrin coat assembly protein AP180 [Bombyx mori]|uniref:Uncharacterized protein n=1 Tax=Bombyx mori TaxID=7091 RepID=A0A8R2AFH5_BOMMO|nr:clathrin coat assembly protein AP180 [Bombyx mori]